MKKTEKLLALILCAVMIAGLLGGCQGKPKRTTKETDETTYGIDVARYQGTIRWAEVAASGVDFAMVRVGMRGMAEGEISPDSNARYNLQEAEKYGVKLGVYFFSTAISKEEAVEEADWTADFIAQYPITYPVVYDCEGFTDTESRQYGMSKTERTDIALAFLKRIEQRGYEGMFYAAKNELQDEPCGRPPGLKNIIKSGWRSSPGMLTRPCIPPAMPAVIRCGSTPWREAFRAFPRR